MEQGHTMMDFEFDFRYASNERAALGSTIYPYAIAAKSMADQMVTDGRQDNILAASEILQSGWAIALIAGVIALSLAGAAIGRRVVKRHLAA